MSENRNNLSQDVVYPFDQKISSTSEGDRKQQRSFEPSILDFDAKTTKTKRKKVKDTYVDHEYHDYSMVRYEDIPSNCLTSYQINHKGGNDVLFPQKLHKVITDAEIYDPDIISWAPHGRCFTVKDREMFRKKYLVPNFQMKTYASYQRQLNRYEFKNITRYSSKDKGSYYHELFLRGRPGLCRIIRGKRNKGNGFKPLSSPQDEPDFCSYPPCYEVNMGLEASSFVSFEQETPDIPTSSSVITNQPSSQELPQANGEVVQNPFTQFMLQPTWVGNIPRLLLVDGMVTMPILQSTLQLAGIMNTSNIHMPHQNGYLPTQSPFLSLRNESLCVPRPVLSTPLVVRSVASGQTLDIPAPTQQTDNQPRSNTTHPPNVYG